MRRGTTERLTFDTGMDLSQLDLLDVSFAQHGVVLVSKNLSQCEIDGDKVIVNLTESDTLKFDSNKNPVHVQMRMGIGDTRLASNIMYMRVDPILKDGMLR